MAHITVETLLGLAARREPAESPTAAGDAAFSSALQAAVGREQSDETTQSKSEDSVSTGSGDQTEEDAAETPTTERVNIEGEQGGEEGDSAEISAPAVVASEVLEVEAAPTETVSAETLPAEDVQSGRNITAGVTTSEPTGQDDAPGAVTEKVSRNIPSEPAVPDAPEPNATESGGPRLEASDAVPADKLDEAPAGTAVEAEASDARESHDSEAPAASPQTWETDDRSLATNRVQPVSQEQSSDEGARATEATPQVDSSAVQRNAEHADGGPARERSTPTSTNEPLATGPREVDAEPSQPLVADGEVESGERVRPVEGAAEGKASDARPPATLQRVASSRGVQPQWSPAEGEAAAEVDRPRFLQRVGGAIEAAERRGGAIRVRLSPPELGSLRIELAVKQGTLTATLETETPAARQVLLDHLPALRARLAEQEIRVEQFDVDVRRDGRHAPDDGEHRQPSDADHRRRGERAKRDSSGTAQTTTSPSGLPGEHDSAENLDVRI